MKMTKNRPAF